MSASIFNFLGNGSTGALDWLYIRHMVVRTRNGISCVIGEYCLIFFIFTFRIPGRYRLFQVISEFCLVGLFFWCGVVGFFWFFFGLQIGQFLNQQGQTAVSSNFAKYHWFLIVRVVKHGGFNLGFNIYFQVFLYLKLEAKQEYEKTGRKSDWGIKIPKPHSTL